jgi:hypothetical protein
MSEERKILHITVIKDRVTSKKNFEVDSVLIGRTPESALQLNHPDVSRKHCCLWIRGHEIWIEDLGSSNGTFVDGIKLTAHAPQAVHPGEKITIGLKTGFTLETELEIMAPVLEYQEFPSQAPEPAPEPINDTIIFSPPAAKAVPGPQVVHYSPPTPQVKPTPEETIAVAAPQRAVDINDIEAERMFQDARKQAGKIVLDAKLKAEEEVRHILERADVTRKEAEEFYRLRMQEAYQAAEEIHTQARTESEELIEKTRKSCEQIRKQADQTAAGLLADAKRDSEMLTSSAATQARQMKEQRLQEADAIIARKEVALLEEARASIATDQHDFTTRIQRETEEHQSRIQHEMEGHEARMTEAKVLLDLELSEVERLRKEKQDLESAVRTLNESKEEKARGLASLEERALNLETQRREVDKKLVSFESSLKNLTQDHDKKKREFEELTQQCKLVEDKKSQATREVDASILQLRAGFESAKAKMQAQEEEHLTHLKLATAKQVQQVEKELLLELSRKRTNLVKEILHSLEKTSAVISGQAPAWRSETPLLEESLLKLIEGTLYTAKSDGTAIPQQVNLTGKRRKERIRHVGMGAAFGAFLVVAGLQIIRGMQGPSPLERAVASEAEERRKDLEDRKFNPEKTPELKEHYVDAVIYTEGFVETYTSDEFQKRWSRAASKHMLKLWKVDEDSALKAVSIANALVKNLAERKEKIHPDFVKDALGKMQEAEAEAQKRISEVLGSNVRRESLKKFEREFYLKFREH